MNDQTQVTISTSTTHITITGTKCAAQVLKNLLEREEQKRGYPMPPGLLPPKASREENKSPKTDLKK